MTKEVSPTHSGAVEGVAWAASRGSGAWPGAEHRSPAGRQDAGLGTGFSGAKDSSWNMEGGSLRIFCERKEGEREGGRQPVSLEPLFC